MRMDRPNRLYSEWELWTQETQSPWIFLCEALEMTHVSIFCLIVSALDADSLNWLLKCKYSLIKQLKSVKSAVSLSLKRRLLLLHMRFLEPAWCRSELETEVCTLDQVPEPQRPLPFPVLLTSFMHESQQHPETEAPLLPPPLSVTTYSLTGQPLSPGFETKISFAYFRTPLAFSRTPSAFIPPRRLASSLWLPGDWSHL